MTSRIRDRSGSQPRRPQDLLTCLVCCQYFEDPRQLPCGHTFCRKCLERHHALHLRESETKARPASDERRTVGLLPCPVAPSCLHVAIVPPEGVAGFPINEQIAGIKERVVNRMAENILRRMPAGAGSCASDTMSSYSDASCETTCSAPAGNCGYDSGDDDDPSKFGGGVDSQSGHRNSKFTRFFDDNNRATADDGAEGETTSTRYTPGVRSDRRRVGYSSSFQHRRRRVNVSSPTAFDDASPMREFLRRQPSRSGSAPHLDEEKPSVRGVHLREPLRRNASSYTEKTRPTSAILEEILFNANRDRTDSCVNDHPDANTSSGSYYSKYQPKHYTPDEDSPKDSFSNVETGNQRSNIEPEKTKYSFSSTTTHQQTHEPDLRTSKNNSDRKSHVTETDNGSTSRQPHEEPTSHYSRSFSASRSHVGDEHEDLSRHSHERVSSSSRLLGNRTRVGAEQADMPGDSWTSSRNRRKLPDPPVQSYAERIKSKYRSPAESGCHTQDTSSDRSHFGNGDSATRLGQGRVSPIHNNRNSAHDLPKYESPYRSANSSSSSVYNTPDRTDFSNQTRSTSNGQSTPNLKPNLPHFSGSSSMREASHSPLRGNGMNMSWNGNGTHPMESPWIGLSKYLDGSDSSDDSDCDMIINRSSKKNSDKPDAPSADKQANVSSSVAGESGTVIITDGTKQGAVDNVTSNVTQLEGDFSSVDGNLEQEKNLEFSEQVTLNGAKEQANNSDEAFPPVQNGCNSNCSINGSAEHVINGTSSASNTNGHANVNTAKHVVSDVNGNASDADKENGIQKGGRNFDELFRAARAKYSTYEAPTDVVRKAVLAPICCEELTPRWRMQRDDFAAPTSVAIASTGSVFITDMANSSLDYVDEDGNLIHSITGMKPYCVTAISVGDTEKIYVGDRKSRTVRVFDSYGCDLVQWDSEATSFGWIAGIASLRNGNLVIVDRERCKIGVYTIAGDRVSEFGAYGVNEKQVCMADFVAVDSHDRVIVADSGNHCLKMFDPNAAGKPIGRISQRGDGDGFLHWPKGVAVDKHDNIIVADTNNNRVSQFAADGQFISHLLTDTPKPYNVTVNGAGDMLGITHFALSGFSQVDIYSFGLTE